MIYDWKKIRKEYKKLGCPGDVYDPTGIPFESCRWIVLDSERSIGKTTNILLLGLIMHKLYGVQIQYVRETPDMLFPKNAGTLCDVISGRGYVSKLTGGKYSGMTYYHRKWYYCNYDDDFKVCEKSEPVISCLDINENLSYKSGYNAPKGDFIVFDEFISNKYREGEFVDFCDLVKTIGRDREDLTIVLLGNSTDLFHPIFGELECQDLIQTMQFGEHLQYKTSGGTDIYLELCGNINPKRQKINQMFFGFKNPRLASITGAGWAMNNYPHYGKDDPEDPRVILDRSRYIRCQNSLYVQVELVSTKELGLHCIVHKATPAKIPDHAVIWTLGDLTEHRERFGLGYSTLDQHIVRLRGLNKWYYQSNAIGSCVSTYFRMASQR